MKICVCDFCGRVINNHKDEVGITFSCLNKDIIPNCVKYYHVCPACFKKIINLKNVDVYKLAEFKR